MTPGQLRAAAARVESDDLALLAMLVDRTPVADVAETLHLDRRRMARRVEWLLARLRPRAGSPQRPERPNGLKPPLIGADAGGGISGPPVFPCRASPHVPLRGNRRLVHALSAATALGVLAHAAFVLFGLDLGGAALYDQGAYYLALAGATALCAARAVLVFAERAGWLALAAGMACWLAGSLWWELGYANDVEPPYPSMADALWLAFYPCAWAALVLMVRERVRRFPPSVWLDGLVGAFAFAALAEVLVLEPILGATSGSFAALATNAAYPVGDSLLGAFVVGIFALLGWRPGRAWLALGTGLLLLQVADSVYLVQVAHESYVTGTAIDILWPAGMAMLGIAAWQPSERAAASASTAAACCSSRPSSRCSRSAS